MLLVLISCYLWPCSAYLPSLMLCMHMNLMQVETMLCMHMNTMQVKMMLCMHMNFMQVETMLCMHMNTMQVKMMLCMLMNILQVDNMICKFMITSLSHATMFNLWLQPLYVMIMPSSLFLSFMRYCDM